MLVGVYLMLAWRSIELSASGKPWSENLDHDEGFPFMAKFLP